MSLPHMSVHLGEESVFVCVTEFRWGVYIRAV